MNDPHEYSQIQLMGSPLVLPLPVGADVITAGVPITLQPNGSPLYLVYHLTANFFDWFGKGKNVTYICSSPSSFNLGIYGPNPTQIGPPFGRMRAPKINVADGTNNQCEGNFNVGTYYLVFRVGDNGSPVAPITINLKEQLWQVFG
jgi:hypothetical protein